MEYDIDKEYELAINLEKIIIPKLKAISESGNSSTIHRANNLLAVIDCSKRNAEYFKRIDYVITYKEYLKTAEEWLIDLVKGV